MTVYMNTAAVNAMMDALDTHVGTSAVLEIYQGTQPVSPTGATGEEGTLLVSLTADSSAFAGNSSQGILPVNNFTSGTAVATGTAQWFRLYKSGTQGTSTWVMDGSIGLIGSNSDLEVNNTSVVSGQEFKMDGGDNQITGPNLV